MRKLLGLQEAISLSAVDPVRDGRGWAFRDGLGYSLDPVSGFSLLREAYEATEPGYDGHISVPVLWDRETGRIVSNNFPDITIGLATQFGAFSNGTGRDGGAAQPAPGRHFLPGAGVAASFLSTGARRGHAAALPARAARDPCVRDSPAREKAMTAWP